MNQNILANRLVGAVWFMGAMGLLDDAIREHLELKRLSGADPGAVAREERAALGPVVRERQAEHGTEDADDVQMSPGTDGAAVGDSEPAAEIDPSPAGQETIEINMEAELAAGADSAHDRNAAQTAHAASDAHRTHTQSTTEDSLEWEVPGDRPEEEPIVGAGLDAEAKAHDEERDDEEHVEDVLQETPDFLRDTPEQERLWFEQRPPRDFDFNE